MVRSVRPTQLLRRLVLASFGADAVYVLGYFLLPQPFLGFRQEVITVTLVLLLGGVGLLWLAVLLSALVIAGRRHEVGWMGAFAVLGVLGLVVAAIIAFLDNLLTFLATILNIFALGNGYLALALVGLVIFVACPLPVPLAALRYADVLATETP